MQYFTCDILPTRTPCWSPWQLCYYFITIKQIRQAAYWTCHYYNDKCASSNDLFCSDGSVTRLLFVCPDLYASWVLYIGLWCCWKGPCAQRNNRATKKWMTVAVVASPVQMEIHDVQISQGTQGQSRSMHVAHDNIQTQCSQSSAFSFNMSTHALAYLTGANYCLPAQESQCLRAKQNQ